MQIATFLVSNLYVPCVSTFAVMLKTLGQREALFSVLLSGGGMALVLALLTRIVLGGLGLLG